jgi:hypothetical protein
MLTVVPLYCPFMALAISGPICDQSIVSQLTAGPDEPPLAAVVGVVPAIASVGVSAGAVFVAAAAAAGVSVAAAAAAGVSVAAAAAAGVSVAAAAGAVVAGALVGVLSAPHADSNRLNSTIMGINIPQRLLDLDMVTTFLLSEQQMGVIPSIVRGELTRY